MEEVSSSNKMRSRSISSVIVAAEEEGIGRLKRNLIVAVAATSGGKRKTLNSEDGIKKSSIQRKKGGVVSTDKFERRNIIHTRKLRYEIEDGESCERQLLKRKSDSFKKNDSDSGDSLRKTKSDSGYVPNESRNVSEMVVEDENKKNDSDEKFKDFEEGKEKVISSNSNNVSNVNDERDEEEVEIELEKDTFDVNEISIPESNSNVVVHEPETDESERNKNVLIESEPKKIVSDNIRFHHRNEKTLSVSASQHFNKAKSIPKEEYHSIPQTHNKLQSLVDLIMWREVSRSAFIFGFGTFVIVSSSYAKDINLSIVSLMSYIGLFYLAVIFLYRSLLCRGIIDVEDSNYVLGEEEANWVLKLVLPYLNELLSKLKALFSGDPGTTIKLAVLLFVMARCGSCITVWKMAKIANFWILRFRDAWDSCSHKKAVALAIFGLVWNLSSVIARIWAVFLLFVAFRYYQQHYLMRDECMEDEEECDETVEVGHKKGHVACFIDTNKVKKRF